MTRIAKGTPPPGTPAAPAPASYGLPAPPPGPPGDPRAPGAPEPHRPTPPALRQPPWMRQSAETIARDNRPPPFTERHLLIGGSPWPVDFPVVAFDSPHGFALPARAHNPCYRPRADPSGAGINLLVLHWDACNSSRQCFEVLAQRGLSAHLLVGGDGTVYQLLDLAAMTAFHAGPVNERSIGVEIQNPVDPDVNDLQSPPRPVVQTRLAHTDEAVAQLDFHPVQKQRVRQIVAALTQRFAIPRRLPARPDGQALSMASAPPDGRARRGDDLDSGFADSALAPDGFAGVCGHYHVSSVKSDPGFTLWPDLFSSC